RDCQVSGQHGPGDVRMSSDVEAEKREFCEGRISRSIYVSDYAIGQRTRRVFRTFARVLGGRGTLSDEEKQIEMENLLAVTRREVVRPLANSPELIGGSQAQFDDWHRKAVNQLKARCPIRLAGGSHMTVGMAQKLVNLHCKDLWALDLVPEKYSMFFHPIIDRVTLRMLDMRLAWTQLDSYRDYMQLQMALRRLALLSNTYPLALECHNWNEYRPKRERH
ncbi:MAG: hypothetical protein MUQ10_01340, partial [Anaerolineae bacterium]|nr:hypothetical protein [Anaerolineae bacterium]